MAMRVRDRTRSPIEAMPRKRSPLTSPTSIGAPAARQDRHRLRRLGGDAEHPREVVAPPAGDDPHRRVRSGEGAADLADQAVAAHHDGDLAASRRPPAPPRSRARGSAVTTVRKSSPARCAAARSTSGSSLPPRPPPEDGLTIRSVAAARSSSRAESWPRSRCPRPPSPLSTGLQAARSKPRRRTDSGV